MYAKLKGVNDLSSPHANIGVYVTMFESLEQAISVLNDPNEDSLKRVDAVRYLGEIGTEEAIQILVATLEDDDYGVRWAAADELAKLGEKAAPIVLRKLLDPNASTRIFEIAVHIFKNNGDLLIRTKAEALIKALEADHDIEAMTEASKLLNELAG